MRTTIITRQTIHHGAEQVAIVRRDRAYHVVHIDTAQHCTAVPDACFWTYEAAHTRLQQEVARRGKLSLPSGEGV